MASGSESAAVRDALVRLAGQYRSKGEAQILKSLKPAGKSAKQNTDTLKSGPFFLFPIFSPLSFITPKLWFTLDPSNFLRDLCPSPGHKEKKRQLHEGTQQATKPSRVRAINKRRGRLS